MSNSAEYYKQAKFSFASYANLGLGTPSVDELKRDAIGMSDSEATRFASTYTVAA